MILEAAFSLPLCRRLYAANILHLEASSGSHMPVARASCLTDISPACFACVGKRKREREDGLRRMGGGRRWVGGGERERERGGGGGGGEGGDERGA